MSLLRTIVVTTSLSFVAGISLPIRSLYRRDDCSTVQVESGDSCGSLASKCGISGDDFMTYNPQPDLCSTLQVGQHVCCSEGTLPDLTPKQNGDGSCASYTTQAGDYCSAIAATNSITVDDIENFNKQTWGWTGCDHLLAGATICLSDGSPPLPASIENAICGPQVPGTQMPTDGTQLADLNPCPLNACCDIWGQCGTTAEFCTATTSTTGAPGTAAEGTNGCISNCGTEITNFDAPASFFKVGYFEAWNYQRPCLNMQLSSLDKSYTHVHLAFATITEDYQVNASEVIFQMQGADLGSTKKILSFGGWAFSTDPSTYHIFRDGVKQENRDALAQNVVNFVTSNGLDGVDFDWEYPGAPDIPGIPPGNKDDGDNYLAFLRTVKYLLPADKSLSIAAPASFWYLKQFPIKDIADVVDYIIYMTYDLHGQWDYGSSWSMEGCPDGNCLRSHVNATETALSLAMVTKAGVKTSKIIVGVASYGRAFQMTSPGCTGPMCTFTGPDSGATPGQCTQTAGYIANSELSDIINGGSDNVQDFYDEDSGSNILVYNDNQWVAYMNTSTKASRIAAYELYSFGGTSDWAVDLQGGDDGGSLEEMPDPNIQPCDHDTYASFDDIDNDSANIPEYCMNEYIIATQDLMFSQSLDNYNNILADGYDSKFKTYSDYVHELVPGQIEDFVAEKGDQYFTCVVEENKNCCGDCHSVSVCESCDPSCEKSGWANVTADHCPTQTVPGVVNYPYRTTYWNVKDQDAFLKDLDDKYGVDPSWVIFAKTGMGIDPACSGAPCDDIYWYGFPITPNFEVPNPKDMIGKALGSFTDFQQVLSDAAINTASLVYGGNTSDVVDSVSLPVALVPVAVSNMQKVKDIAEKIEKEKMQEMIMLFVTAFLLILPGAGELATAADLAALGRMLSLAGEAGNAALGIYDTVKNPNNAFLNIFGVLLGGLKIADEVANEGTFLTAGALRRGVDASDIAKLPADAQSVLNKVSKIRNVCL